MNEFLEGGTLSADELSPAVLFQAPNSPTKLRLWPTQRKTLTLVVQMFNQVLIYFDDRPRLQANRSITMANCLVSALTCTMSELKNHYLASMADGPSQMIGGHKPPCKIWAKAAANPRIFFLWLPEKAPEARWLSLSFQKVLKPSYIPNKV